MKIDIFPHVIPAKYREVLIKFMSPALQNKYGRILSIKMLYDLDSRFRFMDNYEGLAHVLTLASPSPEEIAGPEDAVNLAMTANDAIAELVVKYPNRFVAGTAVLPMNNIDAALREVDRAIKDLNLKGVQIVTPINEKSLDSPEFMPLFEKMAGYDLPVWIHPARMSDYPDYRTEKESKYTIYSIFGWPYETTVAMTRLIFSGIFDKLPNLKIITHHCGGMVPFFKDRIIGITSKSVSVGVDFGLSKSPIEYYQKFYNDTALYGGTAALMCGYAMFGADHILFGTDMPLGEGGGGVINTGLTIQAIEEMNISPEEKKKIFAGNARKLLNLH